ncbi:MAG TPA: DUF1800 domain-containing protein [Planctomycetota bacterium]|nr:DUF1800 domain-containing protein [Planctomycetota bacterium]
MEQAESADPSRAITRRGLLKGAVGGVAAAAAASAAGTGLLAGAAKAASGPGTLGYGSWDWERFLVERLTMGYTVEEHLHAKALGYDGYLAHQLHFHGIDDSQLESLLHSEFASLALTPGQLWQAYAKTGNEAICVEQLRAASVLSAVYSKRQLVERMVDLWMDHFNLDQKKVTIMATTDHREVIRKHALGTFPDLLIASAHSSAMQCYLDNGSNVKAAPNENYARELMELHTMGVRSGYTEADVKEVARCFTGWTYKNGGWFGTFQFNPSDHDYGAKSVLGHPIGKGGGQSDGDWVLAKLARKPETSKFVAHKLLRHFLTYEPSAGFVDRVADVYRNQRGDLKSMVLEIFDRENVTREGIAKVPKVKRPNHFVVSLLRALDVQIGTDVWTANRGDWMVLYLYLLGMCPFNHVTPDGYPDSAEVWGNSMLPRWRFACDLLESRIPSTVVDLARVERRVGRFTPYTIVDQVDLLLTGGRMTEVDKLELQTFVDGSKRFDERIIRETIALGAQSPSFQLY